MRARWKLLHLHEIEMELGAKFNVTGLGKYDFSERDCLCANYGEKGGARRLSSGGQQS